MTLIKMNPVKHSEILLTRISRILESKIIHNKPMNLNLPNVYNCDLYNNNDEGLAYLIAHFYHKQTFNPTKNLKKIYGLKITYDNNCHSSKFADPIHLYLFSPVPIQLPVTVSDSETENIKDDESD